MAIIAKSEEEANGLSKTFQYSFDKEFEYVPNQGVGTDI